MSRQLSEAQINHLHKLVKEFRAIMEPKYTKGAIEHGGNIWEMSDAELELCETEEIIDLAVYRLTRLLKRQ